MNSQRTVLIISYYFPPTGGVGSQRILKFCKYLPEFGWRPIVVTPKQRHSRTVDDELISQIPESVTVVETGAFLPFNILRKITGHKPNQSAFSPQRSSVFSKIRNLLFTLFCIPDEYWGWIPFAVWRGKKLIQNENITAIISTGPPNSCHVIAKFLQKATDVPWLADLRDLWDMYPHSYNPHGFPWRTSLDVYLEHRTLIQAERIIVTSNAMRETAMKRFPFFAPYQVQVITNGFERIDYPPKPRQKNDKTNIMHVGSLFPWRSLKPFFRALPNVLLSMPELKNEIAFYQIGTAPDAEKQLPKSLGLEHIVRFHEPVSHRESLALMRNADVLLLIVGNLPHAKEMIPAKFFEYLGAERPLLCIGPDGAVRELCEAFDIAFFAPDKIAEIENYILAKVITQHKAQKPITNRDYRQFERRELSKKLADILDLLQTRDDHDF